MGYGSWSSDTYASTKKSYARASTDDIFKHTRSRTIASDMDPHGLGVRESRDSDEHPTSTPIIVGLDETGSMGRIPERMAREKLGTIFETMLKHGVPDPQVLFLGIGDHHSDHFPLQVGQFESETTLLDKWLTSVNLEGNGGGQHFESYPLAWLVAGRHTSTDSWEKRGRKGFLFTIGDEAPWGVIEGDFLRRTLGYGQAEDLTAEQLLAEAEKTWNVYHLHCQDGSYHSRPEVLDPWRRLLGDRLILLQHSDAACETMASLVAVALGADKDKVLSGFDHSTALVVASALSGALATTDGDGPGTGIVKL